MRPFLCSFPDRPLELNKPVIVVAMSKQEAWNNLHQACPFDRIIVEPYKPKEKEVNKNE